MFRARGPGRAKCLHQQGIVPYSPQRGSTTYLCYDEFVQEHPFFYVGCGEVIMIIRESTRNSCPHASTTRTSESVGRWPALSIISLLPIQLCQRGMEKTLHE